jgi:site-specific recombinase XerC
VKPYRHTRHRFETFLLTRGQLPPTNRNERFAMLLDAYRDLLVDQRGMSASTVRNHMRTVTAFLNNAVCSGIPLAKLSMPTVDRFVADSGERVSG